MVMAKSKGATTYLLLYNAAQTGGWLAVLIIMILHLVRFPGDYAGVFDAVEMPLLIFQTAMLLEVLHAAGGLVSSNWFLTGLQILSRILVLWFVTYSLPGIRYLYAVHIMIGAWSISEITRYAFYLCSLLDNVPYLLLWCRYTFFLLLYPLGVGGELMVIVSALPGIRVSRPFTITMPNRFNFSFDFYYLMIFILLIYVPFFPMLYYHMICQRRKYIGGGGKSKSE